MNITCKQAVDYISKKEEGRLSSTQRFALWRHLVVCRLCRIFSAQNKAIIKAISRQTGEQASLTQEEKESMVNKVLNS